MKIVEVQTKKLVPYENNPRNNVDAVDAVAASIEKFGFRVPLVIDTNYTVVAGHTRLLAAQKLGMKKVPCTIVDDLTEAQLRAYRLADNKVAEMATWDIPMLNAELSELGKLADFNIDMSEFGFDVPDDDYVENFFGNDEEEPTAATKEESGDSEATEIVIRVYDEDKQQLVEDFCKENDIEYKVK